MSIGDEMRLNRMYNRQQRYRQADEEEDEVDLGDMMLTKSQYKALYSSKSFARNGLTEAVKQWPNATLPVVINPEFDLNYTERIKDAANYIMNVSCIKFDFKPDIIKDPKYLAVDPSEEGCRSAVRKFLNQKFLRIERKSFFR